MNEVTTSPVGSVMPIKPTSSKGTVDQQTEVSGKKLPEITAEQKVVDKAEAEKPVVKETNVHSAVATMNDYVQSIQRDLHFTVDEESDKTVIKVMDGDSGELIRQIPEEVFLELARKLNEDGEFQLINALG